MGDFPQPTRREKAAYRTADASDAANGAPEKKAEPVIVTRPDAPRDEPDAVARNAKPLPNMSKEEIAALLAVAETNQLTKWARVGDRAKRTILPVALVSTLVGLWLGMIASLIPVAAGIAYCAWPLVTQKKRGWT
ncbi:MAG: hypothetical protein ACRELY_28340 [Polyangiaceae bacterium]